MFVSKMLAVAGVLFLHGVAAFPSLGHASDRTAAVTVADRAAPAAPAVTPGYFLMNCYPFDRADISPKEWWSAVFYCANELDCSDPTFRFQTSNVCRLPETSRDAGRYHIWENMKGDTKSMQSCLFSSGQTFSWQIPSDAQSKADLTVVGNGNTLKQAQTWSGIKDNKITGVVWNSHLCSKIYTFRPKK
ncbi:hypothetical protein B0T24DRAFT_540921 [Lasiosphaeria ovina]|uniref:Ecp2 effector protein domain-containing protein n=1 Tax=Lasiosphaeria ovina TaxID=92902 RepID=A0AAE0TWL2_9PEZI|nr:hypothetical protein B0T24DRAFT_540921 [Lasiosphaeria ovina]